MKTLQKVLGGYFLTHPVYQLNCYVCVSFLLFYIYYFVCGQHVLIKFLIQMTTSRSFRLQYFTMISSAVYSSNCHAFSAVISDRFATLRSVQTQGHSVIVVLILYCVPRLPLSSPALPLATPHVYIALCVAPVCILHCQ